MKKPTARKITTVAMLLAFTTAATFVVKIPIVATEGYFNIGDALIMFSSVIFGPIIGSFVGGVGSCLADLISGYPHWCLPTLLIKGSEGFVIGLIFLLLARTKINRYVSAGLSSFVGGAIMVAGYFFAAWIMKGSAEVAALSLPANFIQCAVGLTLSEVLLFSVEKSGVFEKISVKILFTKKVEEKTK